MKAVVVYESMFGNTKLIAEAVAGGLSRFLEVETFEVGEAPDLSEDVELVVAGGPTHAFGMSRPNTRKTAADQAEGDLVSKGIGIREWIEHLARPTRPVAAATFDTKVDRPRFPGSAAASAHKHLRRTGFRLPIAAETFYVDGSIGPLLEGEYERAHLWGEDLGERVEREQLVRT